MAIRSWVRRLFARAPRPVRQAPARCRPAVEVLEDRVTPATLLVNSLADDTTAGNGRVTLREAIIAANTDTGTDGGGTGNGADVITFAPALTAAGDATITLTQFDTGLDSDEFGPTALRIGSDITIRGPGGANSLTIRRAPSDTDAFRLFYVYNATTPTDAALRLESLTLSGGLARGFGGGGGAAGMGGALFNHGGTLTITNSTLSDNSAVGGSGFVAGQGLGGAVFNLNGTLSVTSSTLTANVAAQGGRQIFSLGDGTPGDGIGDDAPATGTDTSADVTLRNALLGQADTAVTDFVAQTRNGGTSNTNVAPQVTIHGRRGSDPGRPYVLRLSSSDSGQDAIRSWTIRWGDGTVQTVRGDRVQVSHHYPLRTQRYVIRATVTDDDGVKYRTNRRVVRLTFRDPMAALVADSYFALTGVAVDAPQLRLWTAIVHQATDPARWPVAQPAVVVGTEGPAEYATRLVRTLYGQQWQREPTPGELSWALSLFARFPQARLAVARVVGSASGR